MKRLRLAMLAVLLVSPFASRASAAQVVPTARAAAGEDARVCATASPIDSIEVVLQDSTPPRGFATWSDTQPTISQPIVRGRLAASYCVFGLPRVLVLSVARRRVLGLYPAVLVRTRDGDGPRIPVVFAYRKGHRSELIRVKNDTAETLTTEDAYLAGVRAGNRAWQATQRRWPAAIRTAIAEGRLRIGMTKDQAVASWGPPDAVNRSITASSVIEQWVYGTTYVYFTNGALVSIQEFSPSP